MFLLDLFKHKHKAHSKSANSKTQLYKGVYFHGNATYEYMDSKDFRIFNGIFTYKNDFKTLYKTKGEEVVIGNYSNNKKHGLWVYRCNDHHVKRNLKVEYVSGIQSGIYEYRRKGNYYGFRDNCSDTYIHLIMNHGHPSGMINAFIDNSIVSGECDSHGYPHGIWRTDIESEARQYYEIWDHGLLINYYCIDTTTGDRYNEKIDVFIKIKCFVKYECYPIECIIKKGSIRWHGDILSKIDKKKLQV
jgi:hypothetical protein